MDASRVASSPDANRAVRLGGVRFGSGSEASRCSSVLLSPSWRSAQSRHGKATGQRWGTRAREGLQGREGGTHAAKLVVVVALVVDEVLKQLLPAADGGPRERRPALVVWVADVWRGRGERGRGRRRRRGRVQQPAHERQVAVCGWTQQGPSARPTRPPRTSMRTATDAGRPCASATTGPWTMPSGREGAVGRARGARWSTSTGTRADVRPWPPTTTPPLTTRPRPRLAWPTLRRPCASRSPGSTRASSTLYRRQGRTRRPKSSTSARPASACTAREPACLLVNLGPRASSRPLTPFGPPLQGGDGRPEAWHARPPHLDRQGRHRPVLDGRARGRARSSCRRRRQRRWLDASVASTGR